MTDTMARGACPAERARHAGGDGPAPERRNLRRSQPPHESATRCLKTVDRYTVLQPDGSQRAHRALSDALAASGELLLFDEEVPREG
jgi:hypothetical protein